MQMNDPGVEGRWVTNKINEGGRESCKDCVTSWNISSAGTVEDNCENLMTT